MEQPHLTPGVLEFGKLTPLRKEGGAVQENQRDRKRRPHLPLLALYRTRKKKNTQSYSTCSQLPHFSSNSSLHQGVVGLVVDTVAVCSGQFRSEGQELMVGLVG